MDRLALSALLEIDHQGEIVAQEFTPAVIRSVERMTYTNVHLLLEGDAAQRERYGPLVERFELMRELALALNRKRVRRGSIDFDLPEPLIEFDELGEMTGVKRAPRNIAHRIIEEFMLAANEAVASHLENAARRVDLPHPREARPQARDGVRGSWPLHFGYSLGVGAIPVKKIRRDGPASRRNEDCGARSCCADRAWTVSSRNYQKLAAKIEGKPEERILSYLMLRSLKQARYSTDNVGHFALAARDVHALHVAHPAVSGPDRASAAAATRWPEGPPTRR